MDERPDSRNAAEDQALQLSSLTSAESADGAGLRRVLLYSVLGGLCPLIPLPFIDDVLVRYFRRRMVRSQLRHAGFEASEARVRRLTRTKKRGLLLGCLIGVVWYVIKKISRKILYFFAIKDCVDETSGLLHQGWLLQYALNRGLLTPEACADEALDHLRDAIERTCERTDTRPLNQILRRVFDAHMVVLTRAANGVGRLLSAEGASRRDPDAIDRALEGEKVREVGALEQMIDEVARALGAHGSYLRELEAAFDVRFAQRTSGPGGGAGGDEADAEAPPNAFPDEQGGC